MVIITTAWFRFSRCLLFGPHYSCLQSQNTFANVLCTPMAGFSNRACVPARDDAGNFSPGVDLHDRDIYWTDHEVICYRITVCNPIIDSSVTLISSLTIRSTSESLHWRLSARGLLTCRLLCGLVVMCRNCFPQATSVKETQCLIIRDRKAVYYEFGSRNTKSKGITKLGSDLIHVCRDVWCNRRPFSPNVSISRSNRDANLRSSL